MVAADVLHVLHMGRALALAERGRGKTSPNPMVGAVVVDEEGVVVGRGSHEFAGGPHAEVHALDDAGDRARGATLYCTLEPCCHTGRTGPCAPRVVSAGIRRAVIAVEDPNPLVAGKGLSHLRAHGVEVEAGVLAHEAARLNAPFFTVMKHRRPFVTMKVALSRDGMVAGRGPGRTFLTGAAANRLVHRERAEVDAIAVGSGTVIADDPELTARGAFRVRPLTRVVFDRTLRTPPRARLLSTAAAGPIIVMAPADAVGNEDMRRRADALAAAGAEVVLVEAAPGASAAFLGEALRLLAGRGVQSLVVEGGPTLHEAAWRAGLVDRVEMFRTPNLLGDGGVPWLGSDLLDLGMLRDVTHVILGHDELIEGYVHRVD